MILHLLRSHVVLLIFFFFDDKISIVVSLYIIWYIHFDIIPLVASDNVFVDFIDAYTHLKTLASLKSILYSSNYIRWYEYLVLQSMRIRENFIVYVSSQYVSIQALRFYL